MRFTTASLLAVVATLVSGALGEPCAGESQPATVGPLVVTQLPVGAEPAVPATAAATVPADWGDGARIVLLAPDNPPRVLTDGFAAARDPDISFDARRMLFAGKREAGDPWNIFELDLDSGAVRQVTDDPGDVRHPIYLGRIYVITADRPWDQIAFTSTRAGEVEEFGGTAASDVYACRTDGTELRRLTFNPSSDFEPTVLPDGRLLFSSWQRSTLAHGPRGRVSLFAAQTDGLDYAIFVGDEGAPVKHAPCVTPDRRVVFVEGERVAWDGGGTVASVELRRNLHSYRALTREADGLFSAPSPLPDGRVLVARRAADGAGTAEVVVLDPTSGRYEAVFDDPDRHDLQPRAVAARPRPDGRSSPVSDDRPNGVLYALNVYESDLRGHGWIEPGRQLRLRVLEGIPARAAPAEPTIEEPQMLRRRLLGEIEVEPDGSFNVEVPANIPIELQLVDDRGLALRTCSWIWVRNRETRGCIGCHEDGERTPENRFVKALSAPSIALTPPPERRRSVEYERDVEPIVSTRCSTAPCHAGGATVGRVGRDVHPGSARTSPLVWHVSGRDTSRPWDDVGAGESSVAMPPSVVDALSEDERRTLIEWIDLGALKEPAQNGPGGAR